MERLLCGECHGEIKQIYDYNQCDGWDVCQECGAVEPKIIEQMEIELDELTQLKIKSEAMKDANEVAELFLNTPQSDLFKVVTNHIKELSEKLRAEKEFEVQKIKLLGDLKDD